MCMIKKKYTVAFPQMLTVYRGCDTCRRTFVSSFNEEDVVIQIKKLNGEKR